MRLQLASKGDWLERNIHLPLLGFSGRLFAAAIRTSQVCLGYVQHSPPNSLSWRHQELGIHWIVAEHTIRVWCSADGALERVPPMQVPLGGTRHHHPPRSLLKSRDARLADRASFRKRAL